MKVLTKMMREGTEREDTKNLLVFNLSRAFSSGLVQTSCRVISLPMGTPRWVPEASRGNSGQGEATRADLISPQREGCAEETTTDLVLLMPRPERFENLVMVLSEGIIEQTSSEINARSSAKA